jgi:type III pantothenate kinase
MLLAIDVGNTNSKFALFDGDRIVAQWRLRTEAKRTSDEYAAWLTQLMNLDDFDPHAIKGAIMASVVPPVNPNIRRLCETYFNIDFGSATTFDIVDRDGNFVGGVLSPGVELTIESFYLMTARLPRIRVERPASVIGKATVPAMQSGIFWGYVGLIESLIKRIRAEYGEPMKVVATGGLATVFKDEIGLFDAIEPDLMFLGLLEIWRRNRR